MSTIEVVERKDQDGEVVDEETGVQRIGWLEPAELRELLQMLDQH